MSAKDREFSIAEGFIVDHTAMTVQLVGSSTAVPAVQVGGGTLADGDKVLCFPIPSGKRSSLAVLKVN